MAGDERDPPRDPLETLQLEPEALARLRALSAPSPSEGAPRAPQLSVPFELTRPPAVPLLQLLSAEPPRRVSAGRVLLYVLTLVALAGGGVYALVRLGVFGLGLPVP